MTLCCFEKPFQMCSLLCFLAIKTYLCCTVFLALDAVFIFVVFPPLKTEQSGKSQPAPCCPYQILNGARQKSSSYSGQPTTALLAQSFENYLKTKVVGSRDEYRAVGSSLGHVLRFGVQCGHLSCERESGCTLQLDDV